MSFLSFFKKFVAPLAKWYLIALLFLALTTLITVYVPLLVGQIVDGIQNPQGQPLSTFTLMSLAIMGLGLIQIFTRALSRLFIFWPARRIEAETRAHLFNKVLGLPHVFFLSHPPGDLLSRITQDTKDIRIFFTIGVLNLFSLVFVLALALTKMVALSPALTVLTLTPLMLTFFAMKVFTPRLHALSRQNQISLAQLTARALEAFTHIHSIQALGAETVFVSHIQEEARKVYQTNINTIVLRSFLMPIFPSAIAVAQLVNLFYGGLLILQKQLSVGDILAFNIYLGLLAFPLTFIGITVSILQRARSALDRLSLITMSEPEERTAQPQLAPASAASPDTAAKQPLLETKNLSFHYHGQQGAPHSAVLRQVSLSIGSNEKIGIFGPIGCGKSTLMHLVFRLLSPAPRTIFFHGRDIMDDRLAEVRCKIGYAPQIAEFFSDTIEANLLFGLERVPTDTELRAALRQAWIYDEVCSLPSGIHTMIGEKGVKLSGGQKQRLALARLFLRSFDILLLDDPCAAIDEKTEARILRELYSLPQAVLISSHRFKSLEGCDMIYLMDQGRIFDQGTYLELGTKYPDIGTKEHTFVL
jgi:ATP-binding cassette subfamily B protein